MKIACFVVWVVFSMCLCASAAQRTWIGGNADWDLMNANWTGGDEPDSDDEAIFSTANSVHLANAFEQLLGLNLSGGIDLFTNDNDMSVFGPVQLTGANTNLFIQGSPSLFVADDLTINSGADVRLIDGGLTVNKLVGTGLLDINAGGTLSGRGTVNLNDAVAAGTILLVNDGTISAESDPLGHQTVPPVGTLSISASDADTRIDLDGASNTGTVHVMRNQTLDINVPLVSGIFRGTMNLFHNSTLDLPSWSLTGGTINVDNGFVNNPLPVPDIPAEGAFIRGGAFTQTGGTITVVDTDGTLQFDAPFTMNGGTLTNNGLVIFNANATIGAAANFVMAGTQADLTVEANRTVDILQTNFNLDANETSSSQITVHSGGRLNINVSDYDSDAATNAYDGVITLNGGDMSVVTGDAAFVMDGTLNMNNTTGSIPVWKGRSLDIGNDLGVLDADVNIGGVGQSHIDPTAAFVSFNSDADVNVAAGAILNFGAQSAVIFDTVNGANNAEFTGAGEISFSGRVTVREAVTLNMVGGTVDLDGTENVNNIAEAILVDAPLTINAAMLRSYGSNHTSGGNNELLVRNNNSDTGVLTVNLDGADSEWTLNSPGLMRLINDNTPATLLVGSDVNLNGRVTVDGDVRTTARVNIGSTGVVNITTASEPLRLAGGDNTNDPNTIAGGTINGPGILGADTGRALYGFGAINADIDFDDLANLRADNGTLTINGAIVDAGTVGTVDGDGILNIPAAWNSGAVNSINMRGGELKGGTITIDNSDGINGQGLVSSRVINNTKIVAQTPTGTHTLIVQNAANDNDWDGATNAGELIAANGGVLELRDTALFGFTGTISATGGRVFANGFALDFNPGSTINLGGGGGGGKYESTNTTGIGGAVNVAAGTDSTIEVQVNRFLTLQSTSTTTLAGNLRLVSNNAIIEAGAAFSGAGALVIPDNSHLIADANAEINVLLDNQGVFRPSGFETVGRVDLKDYQQGDTGELFVELTGTGLNQFDRLVVNGVAALGGFLDVDIDGGFVPALGDEFNIITALSVSGEFDGLVDSGTPAGLMFHINYLANAVQLKVVASGDFDLNGLFNCLDVDSLTGQIASGLDPIAFDLNGDSQVDAADLSVWLVRAGAANLLSGNPYLPGDANLDGVVDGSDFGIWNSNKFTNLAAWCSGDFTADGFVDGSDFGIWNSRKFTSSDSAASVPEPTSAAFLLWSVWALGSIHWRRNPLG
jgi:hypothetical protein